MIGPWWRDRPDQSSITVRDVPGAANALYDQVRFLTWPPEFEPADTEESS